MSTNKPSIGHVVLEKAPLILIKNWNMMTFRTIKPVAST